MKKAPLLSIIIAVYNTGGEAAGCVLKDCLNSILLQDVSKELFEVVCVNDGSTDNSLEVLQEYASKFENIVIVDQKNAGVGGAKNTGIENASGKYLWLINSDDCIKNGSLRCITDMLLNLSPDIIRVKLKNISEDVFDFNKVLEFKENTYKQKVGYIQPPSDDVTSIIRSDIMNEHKIRFLPGTVYHSDRLLFVQYYLNINFQNNYEIQETVYLRRQRSVSETGRVRYSVKAKNQYVKDSITMAKEYHEILNHQNIENSYLREFVQSQQYFFTEVAIVSIPSSTYDRRETMSYLKEIGVYPYPFLWKNIKKAKGFRNRIIVFLKCFFKYEWIYNIFCFCQSNRNKSAKIERT